ncbi:5'-3' exoribonuclease 1 isoform X2 [Tribolium castaneum]|uniref:5'-3' exoribonuclease 1 isoform X2 n=1 Tax=Tribolium castaneum TaxID=7070 RepID=UPI00046C07F4|nr:PREDICTED: 5'-3' exoribonuclease 1 isoform X2 [Tribolium castaneum]|eukprot:XP_008193749.1 PREDICTED: 5'-3' exoribonuclease 1 isoform X2 [Tribolium castaneum]
MGVPKFFRYISERYPCLSEFVKEYQIPVFDNLYLDMNGIIHMCSHPDDNNPHFRITEEKIFADIFHYIEFLFRMIKPQKVFFMAVDGVAPRAKMNQQRGRRFRSAKDAEKMELEAKKKGEKLPDVERFDSNCITPGTEFMARLHEQLKYFVVSKVSTDNMWKKCKIILSGHETPGEGEHKIMDYIRYIRSQPGYDPNTRHCLYGLDADLIMLGLCTHDPHFSLLREEVKFGKKAKRSNVPEEIRFYLLHLSLMREYLEMEFSPLKEALKDSDKIKFDIENIIDDWILMGFLVGNDFIPNLPNLHISNGALPVLYKAYIEVLPTLDGYINEAGTLNLERFEKFMKKLADVDIKNFEEIQDDLTYFERKTGRKATAHLPVSSKPVKNGEEKKIDPALAELIAATDSLAVSSDEEDFESSISSEEDEAFKSYKDEYYRNKLEFQEVTREVMREQAEGYVRAIQWNLNYYYNGVCSWSWFYPHHYSPYISDIKGFSDLKIDFELGKPFKPYEQLLAVLPPASKKLLPECYHSLMTDDNSLIKSYYPEEFQTDLNGKRQEWEAVVLVPFIDEKNLLNAMKPCNELLTPEEAKRNNHGPMLVYEYTDEDLGVYEPPSYFPKVVNRARCTPVNIEDIRVPKDKLVKGAYPGVVFDVYYPGFPTLKHLKYESKFKKARVKVFEMPSRNESLILRILPSEKYTGDSIPLDLLGKVVWVGWPNLTEAKVIAISNRKEKYVFSGTNNHKVDDRTKNSTFESELEGVSQYYRERMGIEFGNTDVLVHVNLLSGRKYVFTSNMRATLERQFTQIQSNYPLQSIVTDIAIHDDLRTNFQTVSDVFAPNSICFSLTNPYYGSQGTIVDCAESLKNNHLKVSLTVTAEPDLSKAQNIDEKLKRNYMSLANSACQLAMSNYVFSRITGSLFVQTRTNEGLFKTVNIGLDMKFSKKNQETPGYTRKIENVWFYTSKAVDLVREYINNFPEVFRFLASGSNDDLDADAIFGEDGDEKVKSIQTWLKSLPVHNIERRVCGSSVLEPEVVAEIEKEVDQLKDSPKNIVMQIKPHLLYKPEIQTGYLAPDPLARTRVFDRIVNVREGFTVPLGLKGTVIAIHKSPNVLKNENEIYDIVFDKPFAGGLALNCSEQRGYRLSKISFINISYGRRQMEEKTGVPGALRALAKERRNVNTNISTNMYARQQNSAFASVNKAQPSLMGPPYKNNHFNTNQYPVRPQMPIPAYDQPKMKNSFYYMSDFTQMQGSKINKENAVTWRTTEMNNQNRHMRGPNNVTQNTVNSAKPKTEVNTDFLKRILNIDNNVEKSSNPKLNVPVQNCSTSSSRKPEMGTAASATANLLSYYQSNAWGCPRYFYLEQNNGYAAQVVLPSGKSISGKTAKSREEASENVALDALNMLKNSSKPAKTGLPSEFPVPPTKWVQDRQQQNKMPSQVFVNKSYQFKQGGHSQHQRMPPPHQTDYSRRDPESNFSRNPHTSAKAHNFVPLQALKKKQTHGNKNLNTGNKNVNENSPRKKQEKTDVSSNSQNAGISKACELERNDRRDKSAKQRKTRIAARFNQ